MVRLSKRAQREEEERIQLELQQSILDSDGEEEQASVSVFDAVSEETREGAWLMNDLVEYDRRN